MDRLRGVWGLAAGIGVLAFTSCNQNASVTEPTQELTAVDESLDGKGKPQPPPPAPVGIQPTVVDAGDAQANLVNAEGWVLGGRWLDGGPARDYVAWLPGEWLNPIVVFTGTYNGPQSLTDATTGVARLTTSDGRVWKSFNGSDWTLEATLQTPAGQPGISIINNAGELVAPVGSPSVGYYWSSPHGAPEPLPSGHYISTYVRDISDDGVIVGRGTVPDGRNSTRGVPTAWTKNIDGSFSVTPLPLPSGMSSGQAVVAGDDFIIGGYAEGSKSTSQSVPVVWTSSDAGSSFVASLLPTLGCGCGQVDGMSEEGDLVGLSRYSSKGEWRGVLWRRVGTAWTATELAADAGASFYGARDAARLADGTLRVVGATAAGSVVHAVIWDVAP